MATSPISSSTTGELRALLGPLVSPLLRGQDGSLDLAKLPRGSLEELRQFLLTQVKLDGLVFNEHLLDSYHQVLGKEKYRPLLEDLFEEGQNKNGDTEAGAKDPKQDGLLKEFTAELIEISSQNFVNAHIDHETGRQRLRAALFDRDHFSIDARSDLAKAITQIGYQRGGSWSTFQRFNRKISVMNYWNLAVREPDLDGASFLADEILEEMERYDEQVGILEKKYLATPNKVERFAGLERALGAKITDEQIRERAQQATAARLDLNPVSQLKAKLARFWLMVVDDGHWKESNPYKTASNGAFLLRRTEELLKQGEGVKNEADFLKWAETARNFINGGLQVEGEGWNRGLKDFFAPSTVAEMTKSIPQAHRLAFDDLRQYLDEIHHASDMGEAIQINPVAKKQDEAPFDDVKGQFILGLQQAKRSLWYSYKQHRALSRLGSWTADIFGAGDIAEIKVGQTALDQLIQKVEGAQDGSQLASVVQELQEQLKENGGLQLAMRAAEMEGVEQLIGLGQSILILLASRGLIGGAKWLGQLASRAPVATTAAQVMEASVPAAVTTSSSAIGFLAKEGGTRMAKAFALGAYQSAAENAVALASGEVRQGGEHWKNWLKDSASTGLSMMLTAPFPLLGESTAGGNIGKALLLRYGTGGLKIAGRLAVDTAAEIPEEWLDGYFRARMDDFENGVVGFDQAREIGLVSAFGGGHMGIAKELIKGPSHAKTSNGGPSHEDSRPSLELERTPQSLSAFQQMQNLAESYGTQNPLIRQTPMLFPLSHPERVRSVLEHSLKETLLGPLQTMDRSSHTYGLESFLRYSAYASLKKGIKILYPIYWAATRPFLFLRAQEEKAKQKIVADLDKRRVAFESQAPEKGTDYPELLERPDPKKSEQIFNAVLHWSDYQEIAKIRGWDPYLVLARGLKDAPKEEVEVVLQGMFGNDLDKKTDFLIRYPVRQGYPILSRAVAQFIPGGVGQSNAEGFSHYFNLAEAFETMGRKSVTVWDLANQSGIHPQALVYQASQFGEVDDEIYLRSFNLALKFLQDHMAPEEIIIPDLDLFERPTLKAAVIRLWGHARRKDYLPEILACLKNDKDPRVLQAAAWTLAYWKAKEAIGPLSQLAKKTRSALARVASRRAMDHIADDLGLTDELKDWLRDPILGSFNPDNDLIWEQMGGQVISGWLDLSSPPSKPELFSKNKFQNQRLEFAEALLAVSEDYLDRNLRRSELTEYQIVAIRMLLDILLDGSDRSRKKALEDLLNTPEKPLKRFLEARKGRDWDESHEEKLKDVKEFLLRYLRDSKNSLEHRIKLLALLKDDLTIEEVRRIEDELLSNPNTAPAAAQILDEEAVKNWDKYIEEERQRLMTPGAYLSSDNSSKSPSEGGPALEAFTAMIGGMALAGVQSPLAYGAGILFCLGMAHLFSGRGKKDRQFLREKIQENSKSFYRKLNKEGIAQVQKMYQEMAEDPAFQDTYLFRQLETVAGFIGKGVDPEFIIHNTGASGFQLGNMLAGKGSGEFPVTINSLLGFHPDYYYHSLELFALRRGYPNHTLVVTLPVSKLLHWMRENRETFAQKILVQEQIQASLMSSLVRLAQEHGSAKILGLPSMDPKVKKEKDYLLASLKEGGIDGKIFIEAKGLHFEEARASTDAVRRKAAQRWAKPLVGKLDVEQKAYIKGWIDLVLNYAKDEDPLVLYERSAMEFLEEVAAKEGLIVPQIQVLNHIIRPISTQLMDRADKARKKLEKKLPKANYPDHGLYKVVSTWKKERGLLEGMVYHAFGENLGVAMEPWWARVINQGKERDLGIHEALHHLFGLWDDSLQPFYELQWIGQYQVEAGLPIAYQYVKHPSYKVRIHALETLMDLNATEPPENLVELLHPFIGLPELIENETLEISTILKAIRTLGVRPEQSSLLKSYLLALMDSRLEQRTFSLSPDLHYPIKQYVSARAIDMYQFANRQLIASEAEATYHQLGYSQGKAYLDGELNQKNPERRNKALKIILTAGLETYLPQVEKMLWDPDRDNRISVLEILGQFGGTTAVPLIGESLIHDPDPQVRAYAAEVLLRKQDPSAKDLVHFVLQTDWEHTPGRMYLIYLLGLLEDKSAIHLFKKALGEGRPQERLFAAASLARLGHAEEAKETFIEVLNSKDPSIKYFAVNELLAMGEPHGKALYRLIRDGAPETFTNLLREKLPDLFRLLDRFEKGWDKLPRANWDWLRTELKNGALVSPEIKDVPWRRFLKKALKQTQSDLGPFYKLQYQQILEEAARKDYSKEETRARLMTTLQGDFYDRLQEFGGKRESLDFRELMENRLKAGSSVPNWVRAWLGVHPEHRVPMHSLIFTKEELSHLDDPRTGDMALSNSLELYDTLAEQIGPLLGLPKDFLVQKEGDAVRYNFLPIPLLVISLDSLHGKNAVQPEETSDKSTLWEIVRMVKEHKRPLLFSQINRELEGRPKVVPFMAALHDFYHLLTFSQLSEPIQSGALSLIEIMEEMNLIQEDHEGLGAILDGLMNEQDPGFEDIFEEMRHDQLKDPITVETFYLKLKDKIYDHPNRQLILAKFEKIYGDKLGIGEWETLPPSR